MRKAVLFALGHSDGCAGNSKADCHSRLFSF